MASLDINLLRVVQYIANSWLLEDLSVWNHPNHPQIVEVLQLVSDFEFLDTVLHDLDLVSEAFVIQVFLDDLKL